MWEKEKLDELSMHLSVRYTLIRYAIDVESLLKC